MSLTPVFATLPKNRPELQSLPQIRKRTPVSLVFATLATPSPLVHFILFSSSYSRHESLLTSEAPRSWLQICRFVFKQLQDAPPATLFFSCFCMFARGWEGGKLRISARRRYAPE